MNPQPAQSSLTLEEYSAAKRLPVQFLQDLGVTQVGRGLRIPYRDRAGVDLAIRYRHSLDGDRRFTWRSGDQPTLYGLDRLDASADFVVLVEGESDCHTLWLHEINAVGIPGVSVWRDDRHAAHLEAFDRVYVVVEPDLGGNALLVRLEEPRLRERLHLVRFEGFKDPSEVHCADPEGAADIIHAALATAQPWAEYARELEDQVGSDAWVKCEPLAKDPAILDRLDDELSRAGVAGDLRIARLSYLTITSRLLPRPASIVVKGASSTGKSYEVDAALRFFDDSAYLARTSVSEHALVYTEEPFTHRTLVLYEAGATKGNDTFIAYIVRSLLSEGRLVYETVEKTADGMKSRVIDKPGPTGLIVTTTALKLGRELETRLLSVPADDSPTQTASVMLATAAQDRLIVDYEPWLALQRWLSAGEVQVQVPYAETLASMIKPVAVRLRRDFPTLLSLIQAHALLHRASRGKDAAGRIIATIDDYEVVRALVADLMAEGVRTQVPPTVRETVTTVRQLHSSGSSPVTVAQIAEHLGLDHSNAYRRVSHALDLEYLINLAQPRQPLRLVPDSRIPADDEPLLSDGDRLRALHESRPRPQEQTCGDDEPSPEAPLQTPVKRVDP